MPFPTITAGARAVLTGEADAAVAPVENSLQGAVTETLDLLIHGEGLHISHELAIDVVHNLMAAPGVTMRDVKRVYSHPQALGQCTTYLADHLPGAEAAAAISTAGAVEQAMSADVPSAASAPRCVGTRRWSIAAFPRPSTTPRSTVSAPRRGTRWNGSAPRRSARPAASRASTQPTSHC